MILTYEFHGSHSLMEFKPMVELQDDQSKLASSFKTPRTAYMSFATRITLAGEALQNSLDSAAR
jgi:hypothetical protein